MMDIEGGREPRRRDSQEPRVQRTRRQRQGEDRAPSPEEAFRNAGTDDVLLRTLTLHM